MAIFFSSIFSCSSSNNENCVLVLALYKKFLKCNIQSLYIIYEGRKNKLHSHCIIPVSTQTLHNTWQFHILMLLADDFEREARHTYCWSSAFTQTEVTVDTSLLLKAIEEACRIHQFSEAVVFYLHFGGKWKLAVSQQVQQVRYDVLSVHSQCLICVLFCFQYIQVKWVAELTKFMPHTGQAEFDFGLTVIDPHIWLFNAHRSAFNGGYAA